MKSHEQGLITEGFMVTHVLQILYNADEKYVLL